MQNVNATGYEYQQVTVKASIPAIYADAYKSFGWKLKKRSNSKSSAERVALKFKRNYKIWNKAAYVEGIMRLHSSRNHHIIT